MHVLNFLSKNNQNLIGYFESSVTQNSRNQLDLPVFSITQFQEFVLFDNPYLQGIFVCMQIIEMENALMQSFLRAFFFLH